MPGSGVLEQRLDEIADPEAIGRLVKQATLKGEVKGRGDTDDEGGVHTAVDLADDADAGCYLELPAWPSL